MRGDPTATHYETEVHVYCGDERAMHYLIDYMLSKHWWFKVEYQVAEFRLTCNACPEDLVKANLKVVEHAP